LPSRDHCRRDPIRCRTGRGRYAIEAAPPACRALAARCCARDAQPAITPVIVADLCAEVGLDQKKHLAAAGIELSQSCSVVDEWPLDRDLVTDMLNNAIQNAGRYARSRVHLDARLDAGWLVFSVEDDGPGFATLPPACGTGLTVAHRLAFLHRRQEQDGSLHLSNGASLGGARFELRLP
jgi:glucose-6-phosphate-specific signal transduction histidine kinase